MNKSDLKTSMMVQCRNGKHYMVLLGTGIGGDHENVFVRKGGGYMTFDDFYDDLLCIPANDGFPLVNREDEIKIAHEFDVMKVYAPSEAAYIGDIDHCKLIFDRKAGVM